MKANVDANLFRLVNTVASKDVIRYYLHGVYIEPHQTSGAIMVATDGRRMLVAHDVEGSCEQPMIIKLPAFGLVQCKPPVMFGAKRRLEISASENGDSSAKIIGVTPAKVRGELATRADVMTVFNVVIDGKYPDWRKVIPTPDGQTTGVLAYNGKYLRDLAALSIDIGRSTGVEGAFTIEQSDPGAPSLIRWSGIDNIFGVLMAMRFDSKFSKLPKFMNQEMAEAAE